MKHKKVSPEDEYRKLENEEEPENTEINKHHFSNSKVSESHESIASLGEMESWTDMYGNSPLRHKGD